MSEQPKFKVVKKGDRPQKTDAEYIEQHKDSLLHLLIKENPERARYILAKLSGERAQAA